MASIPNVPFPDPSIPADAGMPPSTSPRTGAPEPAADAQAPPDVSSGNDDGCEVIDMPGYFPGLSNSQQKALGALIDGKSAIYAAVMAGVSRATVYRWSHQHPPFAAALNLCLRQQRDEFKVRLSLMQEKVLKVIEYLLDKQDFRVVKLYISFLEKQRIGPGTQAGVARRLARPYRKAAEAAMSKLVPFREMDQEIRHDLMLRYLGNHDAATAIEHKPPGKEKKKKQ